MREWISYLGEIVLVTAVSGLLYTVSPDGNLKKHLQFVISLCIVVSLAVPMFSMVVDLPKIFENGMEEAEKSEIKTNAELTDSLISASKKEVEKGIVAYIAEKYVIAEKDVSAETILNIENPEAIEIREIKIVISGEYPISLEKIRNDLNEMFLGKTHVTVSLAE